ncbi:hypothetical protein HPB50_007984 [Hyalomma asiaticum]|uniref:Uncharacterized protein n=1 Tax=Hyalomma asiaticum TaxID=266040 RepID=A0ACB7RSJ7_HYAAI|nr:hypothetical protein HPB50_007984 [Hyalomma asiaticum]
MLCLLPSSNGNGMLTIALIEMLGMEVLLLAARYTCEKMVGQRDSSSHSSCRTKLKRKRRRNTDASTSPSTTCIVPKDMPLPDADNDVVYLAGDNEKGEAQESRRQPRGPHRGSRLRDSSMLRRHTPRFISQRPTKSRKIADSSMVRDVDGSSCEGDDQLELHLSGTFPAKLGTNPRATSLLRTFRGQRLRSRARRTTGAEVAYDEREEGSFEGMHGLMFKGEKARIVKEKLQVVGTVEVHEPRNLGVSKLSSHRAALDARPSTAGVHEILAAQPLSLGSTNTARVHDLKSPLKISSTSMRHSSSHSFIADEKLDTATIDTAKPCLLPSSNGNGMFTIAIIETLAVAMLLLAAGYACEKTVGQRDSSSRSSCRTKLKRYAFAGRRPRQGVLGGGHAEGEAQESRRQPRGPHRGSCLRDSSMPRRHQPPRLISQRPAKSRKIADSSTVRDVDGSSCEGDEQLEMHLSGTFPAKPVADPRATSLRRTFRGQRLRSRAHRTAGAEVAYDERDEGSFKAMHGIGFKDEQARSVKFIYQVVGTVEVHEPRNLGESPNSAPIVPPWTRDLPQPEFMKDLQRSHPLEARRILLACRSSKVR